MRFGGSLLGLMLAACLALATQGAAAQGLQRLYVMDCGHNAAQDQSRWSPGVNVGKPIDLSDNCDLFSRPRPW